jgi:anti-sigma B factor antagonist
MTTYLDIAERRVESVTILELSGRFVVDEGDRAFRDRVDALVRAGRTHLIVDLRNVTYIDSGGVGVLVSKYVTVGNKGGRLKLLCLSRRACRVLGVAGLLNVFEVFESEEDALRSFHTSTMTSQ